MRRTALWVLVPLAVACEVPPELGEAHPGRRSRAYDSTDYTVQLLGMLPGSFASEARAINARGQIVGGSHETGRIRAFLWERGTMTELGALSTGGSVEVRDLSDRGQAVGGARSEGANHIFLWEAGEMEDLGILPGRRQSIAWGVNNRGQAAGYAYGGGFFLPFLAEDDELYRLRGPGVIGGIASDINDQGEVAGFGIWSDGRIHACLWSDVDEVEDLGTLGGERSRAWAVNANGVVVGASETATGPGQAFVWSGGEMTALPTPEGASESHALDLDLHGQVVGYAVIDDVDVPVLWEDGEAILLPLPPGENQGRARAINDRGQIVGNVGSANANVGTARAVLWHLEGAL